MNMLYIFWDHSEIGAEYQGFTMEKKSHESITTSLNSCFLRLTGAVQVASRKTLGNVKG